MSDNGTGMRCRRCGGRLRVAETQATGFTVKRWRKCDDCGGRWQTLEAEVERDHALLARVLKQAESMRENITQDAGALVEWLREIVDVDAEQ